MGKIDTAKYGATYSPSEFMKVTTKKIPLLKEVKDGKFIWGEVEVFEPIPNDESENNSQL